MIYRTIAPCKKKKGFEGHPEDFYDISLSRLKEVLSEKLDTYEILRETKIMMLLVDTSSGYKISIFPSARVFIHGSLEEEEALKILNIIGSAVVEISSNG
jgi:hypothetical protein